MRQFDIIPQIESSQLSTLSIVPYMFDALGHWNYYLVANLMGVNKLFPKYQNIEND